MERHLHHIIPKHRGKPWSEARRAAQQKRVEA